MRLIRLMVTSVIISAMLVLCSGCDNAVPRAEEHVAASPKYLNSAQLPSDLQNALIKHGHALIIGVFAYADPEWRPLPTVPTDLSLMQENLNPHFATIDVMPNPNIQQLRDGLREFFNKYGPDATGRLFIYYAGHGFTQNNKNTSVELGFLTASNTPNNDTDENGAAANALSMNELESMSNAAQTKQILMVFDSCFSGSIFSTRGAQTITKSDAESVRRAIDYPARSYITAGGAGERIPADSQFAIQFLKGISGAADYYQGGFVTSTELGEYLQHEMPKINRNAVPEWGMSNAFHRNTGDFVFLSRPYKENSVDEPIRRSQAPPQPAPAPPVPPAGKFLETVRDPTRVSSRFGRIDHGSGEYYEGEIQDGRANGQGEYVFENGDDYRGSFLNDKFDGSGILAWHSGDRYEGNWKADMQEGFGIHYFAGGDRYEGNWKAGRRVGEGAMFFSNGSEYRGGWVNDKMDGSGILIFPDGNKIKGQWRSGHEFGPATYENVTGTRSDGTWVNGCFKTDVVYICEPSIAQKLEY